MEHSGSDNYVICPHCDMRVSRRTFRRHRLTYYSTSTKTWQRQRRLKKKDFRSASKAGEIGTSWLTGGSLGTIMFEEMWEKTTTTPSTSGTGTNAKKDIEEINLQAMWEENSFCEMSLNLTTDTTLEMNSFPASDGPRQATSNAVPMETGDNGCWSHLLEELQGGTGLEHVTGIAVGQASTGTDDGVLPQVDTEDRESGDSRDLKISDPEDESSVLEAESRSGVSGAGRSSTSDRSDNSASEQEEPDEDGSDEIWADVPIEEVLKDLGAETCMENTTPVLTVHTPRSTVCMLLSWILSFLLVWKSVHMVSDAAMERLMDFLFDWLKICSQQDAVLLGMASSFPASMYMLRKWAGLDRDAFLRYTVCTKCSALYVLEDLVYTNRHGVKCVRSCQNVRYRRGKYASPCRNQLCKKVILKGGKIQFYPIRVYCYRSIARSLQSILQRPGVEEECQFWKKRNVHHTGGSQKLADVYDGKVWKEFREELLDHENTYGLMMNLDWFRPFKHRATSVGVIYMALLNLPREVRFKRENIMIVGIIPSIDARDEHTGKIRREPASLNPFLKPMVDELQELWRPGKEIPTYKHPTGVNIRTALLCATCDTPAAKKLCGFLSHSANYPCSRCKKYFPGKVGEKNFGGFDRTQWPPRGYAAHKRQCNEIRNAATYTECQKLESKYGCRYSFLQELEYFDIIRFSVIDVMHNAFLGTAKSMWRMWTDELGLIGPEELEKIQERLQRMKMPSDSGSLPSDMAAHAGYFNAHEWKLWTLYYSLFALKGILPEKDFKLWQTFVLAVRFICRPCITVDNVTVSDKLFLKFGREFESLYGSKYVKPNMHLHCHIKECILDFGSVYGFWLFTFERYNFFLGSYKNNHRNVEITIMRSFLSDTHIYSMRDSLPNEYGEIMLPHFPYDNSIKMPYVNKSALAFIPESSLMDCRQFWNELDAITLPDQCRIGGLESYEIDTLQDTYCAMYPEASSVTVPSLFYKYTNLHIGGEHITSQQYSRSSRSCYISASWCNEHSEIGDHHTRPGQIKYFLKQTVVIDCVELVHILALVEWFMQHPDGNAGYLNPITVSKDEYLPFGEASFIPVQRISNKLAFAKQNVNGYKSVVFSPVEPKVYL